MLKRVFATILTTVMVLGLVACGNSSAEEKTSEKEEKDTISIGISADMEPFVNICIPLIEDAGYKVDLQVYDDWTMPNTALQEGKIDCNYFQHTPYMELFNEENDADLVMLDPLLEYSLWGLFSEKYSSVDEVEDGASIAIPDDASNRDIALKLVQNAGLITLSEKPIDEYYDIVDIVENPKNIKFDVIEYYTIFTVMADEDMVVTSSREYLEHDGDTANALYSEGNEGDALGFTVRSEDKDSAWAQDMIKAIATDAFKEGVEKLYPGCCGFAY